jgi:hypothetical protein
MYNASRANVHGSIVQDWCRIPLLLNVQHVFFGSKVDSVTLLIMNYLMTQGVCRKKTLFQGWFILVLMGSVPPKASNMEL